MNVLLELLLFIIHSPLLLDSSFIMSHRASSSLETQSSIYTFDQSLTFLCIFKGYFIAKLLPLGTSVTADNSRKVTEIKGLYLDFKFFLNVSLLERPLTVLFVTLLYIVIFFGLSVHIFEKGQNLKNPKTG